MYFGTRSWALKPEYSGMTEKAHQDYVVTRNIIKDLTKPDGMAILLRAMAQTFIGCNITTAPSSTIKGG